MKLESNRRVRIVGGTTISVLLVMALCTFMVYHQSQSRLQHKNEAVREIKETGDSNMSPESLPVRIRRYIRLSALAATLSTIPRNDIRCVRTCGGYVASLRRAHLRNRFYRFGNRRNFVPSYLSCVGLCTGTPPPVVPPGGNEPPGQQTTTEILTITEVPATTEMSATTEMPATTEIPATTEMPTTTEMPAMPTTTDIIIEI